jgi:hypothetical protein
MRVEMRRQHRSSDFLQSLLGGLAHQAHRRQSLDPPTALTPWRFDRVGTDCMNKRHRLYRLLSLKE